MEPQAKTQAKTQAKPQVPAQSDTDLLDPELAQKPRKLDGKPDGLPDKFWDADRGEIRTGALVKSYLSLERKIGTAKPGTPETPTIPNSPDEYNITPPSDAFLSDPDVNQRLHAAGFTNEQAQIVYDLAQEVVAPLVEQLTADLQSEAEIEKLIVHFGGPERWREIAAELRKWGHANLNPQAFDALSSSKDGVLMMHRMMAGKEPGLMGNGAQRVGPQSREDLRDMMKDPRYWRERDPQYIDQVKSGFARLYPD